MPMSNFDKYSIHQPIFESIDLYENVTDDLINISDKKYSIKWPYVSMNERVFEIDSFLNYNTVNYILDKHADSHFLIRLHPYRIYDKIPFMIRGEAPIRPMNPTWLDN